MDKLVSHGIRMLEIIEGENDFFRNDAKRQADIARAVYDTILRVQMLERKADRKTEPQRNMAEDIVRSFGFKAESYRQAKAKDEPQTEREGE